MTSNRFACDMTGFTLEQRESHVSAVRNLFRAVEQIDEVPAGYTFRFPATATYIEILGAFLALERRCCPFFDFTVNLPAGASSFRLGISGPNGVKPFIRAEFGAALPAAVRFEG